MSLDTKSTWVCVELRGTRKENVLVYVIMGFAFNMLQQKENVKASGLVKFVAQTEKKNGDKVEMDL